MRPGNGSICQMPHRFATDQPPATSVLQGSSWFVGGLVSSVQSGSRLALVHCEYTLRLSGS